MACYNVSCGISGISLGAEAMVLVPLIPVRFPAALTAAHLVEDIPACALFQPLCLPLFGDHDTYGRLTAIDQTAAVEKLETYFGLSIETFAAHFTDCNDREKQPMLPANGAGMYIHRHIWDVCAHPTYDPWGTPQERETDTAWEAIHFRRQHALWQTLYRDVTDTDWYQQAVSALVAVQATMYACNKMFMPTPSGYQCGNYYAERLLHETTLAILTAYIREEEASREENDGD